MLSALLSTFLKVSRRARHMAHTRLPRGGLPGSALRKQSNGETSKECSVNITVQICGQKSVVIENTAQIRRLQKGLTNFSPEAHSSFDTKSVGTASCCQRCSAPSRRARHMAHTMLPHGGSLGSALKKQSRIQACENRGLRISGLTSAVQP